MELTDRGAEGGISVTPVFRGHRIYGAPLGDPTDNNEGQWVCEAISEQTDLPSLLYVGSPRGHPK